MLPGAPLSILWQEPYFLSHCPPVCLRNLVSEITPSDMAPRLPTSKLHLIRDMIESQSFTTSQMAEEAESTKLTVINIRRNLRQFGTIYAPQTRTGRKQTVTPLMIKALCEHLSEKPGLYLDEMAVFLWDEFRIMVTTSSIRRALVATGWSKKAARQRAKERNAGLRNYYLHNLSEFQSYHLIYVDKSGCDKRIGFRRTGWATSWQSSSASYSVPPRPAISDSTRVFPRWNRPLASLPRLYGCYGV